MELKNNNSTAPVILIPAYTCSSVLVETVESLLQSNIFQAIVCVNDGSGEEYDEYFNQLRQIGVRVLTHVVNLGKGRALKTGMNDIAFRFPDSVGIVTVDADGQHLVEDAISVGKALEELSNSLILGQRSFDKTTPFRSRFGNTVTRYVMKMFGGLTIYDTQTGLRGIPMRFVPVLLRLNTDGYDFELDMLLKTRELNIQINEVPIQTVYIDDNQSSHFNPVLDSMRIYYIFLRFNISSIITVIIDYFIFSMFVFSGWSIAYGIFFGRGFAGIVNYLINRNIVFRSDSDFRRSLLLYSFSVVFLGLISYWIIFTIDMVFNINLLLAKMITEGGLYIFSFLLQRDIVFSRKHNES